MAEKKCMQRERRFPRFPWSRCCGVNLTQVGESCESTQDVGDEH